MVCDASLSINEKKELRIFFKRDGQDVRLLVKRMRSASDQLLENSLIKKLIILTEVDWSRQATTEPTAPLPATAASTEN